MLFSLRAAVLVSLVGLFASITPAAAATMCEVGAYRGPAGDFVTVFEPLAGEADRSPRSAAAGCAGRAGGAAGGHRAGKRCWQEL
jgi:hypothetical protein